MLTDGVEFLLTAFFELTLFALFFIFVYRLFTQSVLPLLHEQIEQRKKNESDLKEKDNLLDLSRKSLEKIIKQQEEELFVLDKKVQIWNQFLVQKNNEEELRDELLLQLVKNKRKEQEANLRVSKTEKIVIPDSVRLAYEEIENLYAGKRGELLLKELIIKVGPK
jgi:hypothetical protein